MIFWFQFFLLFFLLKYVIAPDWMVWLRIHIQININYFHWFWGSMEETIQRLTKEKMDLMKQHSQELLLKDKTIHDLKEQLSLSESENDQLLARLNSFQNLIISCTKKMSDLLKTIEFDDSFDDKEMLEDFQKLSNSQKHVSNSFENSQGSLSDFGSRDFEMHPLEACLSKLQKAWEAIIKELKTHKRDESLTKYLKEQLSIMEEEQRALRTQKGILQSIHNESQKSRREIVERTKKQIEAALKSSQLDLEKMSAPELKDKIGSLVIGMEELKKKTNRLQEELYVTKSEFTDKLEYIKQQSAKIKEKSENQVGKMEKQMNLLKSSISKH